MNSKVLKFLLLTSFIFTTHANATSSCEGLSDCKLEICLKESELKEAKNFDDLNKILDLQNSIVKMKNACSFTPESSAEYQTELQKLQAEYKKDLDKTFKEYDISLKEAEGKGKERKKYLAKSKYETKIQNKTNEYETKLQRLNRKYNK